MTLKQSLMPVVRCCTSLDQRALRMLTPMLNDFHITDGCGSIDKLQDPLWVKLGSPGNTLCVESSLIFKKKLDIYIYRTHHRNTCICTYAFAFAKGISTTLSCLRGSAPPEIMKLIQAKKGQGSSTLGVISSILFL